MTMTMKGKTWCKAPFHKKVFFLISSHFSLLSNQRNMEQMMKTLFLGAIMLLLPNLLDACATSKEYKKCYSDCEAEFYGRHTNQSPSKLTTYCGSKCKHLLDRYVYFEHLSWPETFLSAPILEDLYLLKVFSAKTDDQLIKG